VLTGFERRIVVGKQVSSRRPEDYLYLFGMDLIDFDVEKIKKNKARFQKIKLLLNSR
jgi:hypothetical protein